MVKKNLQRLVRPLQYLALIGLALITVKSMDLLTGAEQVHALPEYTTRTGEPCSACHVSAGGGGPRTMVGLLWAARGRPDILPELPGMLIAPGVEDGAELYDTACAGCHGLSGEGLVGISLVNRDISRAAMRVFITQGIPELEMPPFAGQFTDSQLDALTDFATELSRGVVPPEEYPLPTPAFTCDPVATDTCGE